MKKTKKLFALLLAFAMIMGMAITASAATVDNQTGHSYDAYQVFSGTQSENGVALGDIVWGNGVDGNKLLADLITLESFKGCKDAASVAVVLEGQSDKSQDAKDFANIAAKHLTSNKTSISKNATSVTLAAGYYLLV